MLDLVQKWRILILAGETETPVKKGPRGGGCVSFTASSFLRVAFFVTEGYVDTYSGHGEASRTFR